MNEAMAKRFFEFVKYDPETGVFTWVKSPSANSPKGSIAGSTDTAGYRRISLLGKQVSAHRLAVLWMTGSMPEDEVDHINGIRSDNRWANLRVCDQSQNRQNVNIRSDNKVGVKGVRITKNGRFEAQVIANKTRKSATFMTLSEAAEWVRSTRIAMHGEFAKHA